MNTPFTIKNLFFGFVLCFAFQLNGQTPPVQKDYNEMSLEELLNLEVSTASRAKEKITEAPATVYVITSQEIASRGYTSLRDVLEDVPDFQIHDNSSAETYNVVTCRGLPGADHFIILWNGSRINSGAASSYALDNNFSIRFAERIEIAIGPSSAVYGADGFAAVINIITESGEAIQGAKASLSYGMFNTTDNALQAGFKKGDFALSLGMSYFKTDGPKLYEGYDNSFAWYNQQYATNGNVLANPFSTDTITLGSIEEWGMRRRAYTLNAKINYDNFEFGYYGSSEIHPSYIGIKPEYTVYNNNSYYGYNINTLFARHRYTDRQNKFGSDLQLSSTYFELNRNSGYKDTYSGYEKTFKAAYNRSFDLSVIFSYNINESHRFSGGLSGRYLDVLPETADLLKRYDNSKSPEVQGLYYPGSNVIDSSGNDLTIPQDFYFYADRFVGGFAQYQSNIKNILFLTLGGRIDYNDRYGAQFNPRAGIVFKPTKNFRMKFLYGEAFLSPSPEAAYSHFGSFYFDEQEQKLKSDFFRLTNPDLQPTKLRAGEANFALDLKNISFSLGGYYNAVNNLTVIDIDTASHTFKGVEVYEVEIAKSTGKEKTYGTTARIDYRKKTDEGSVNFYAAYSYTGGSTFNEEEFILSAAHVVKASFSYTWKGLTVSPRFFWRSRVFTPKSVADITGLNEGVVTTPDLDEPGNYHLGSKAAFLGSLFVKYSFLNPSTNSSHFTLDGFVNVRNITNSKWYAPGAALTETFAASPQDPLRITVGISVGFNGKKRE